MLLLIFFIFGGNRCLRTCWFTVQLPATAGTGLGQSWARNSVHVSHGSPGTPLPEMSLLPAGVHISREQDPEPDLEPCPSNMGHECLNLHSKTPCPQMIRKPGTVD